MLVELDVFSGRPNPQWYVDEPIDQQIRELHRQLASTTTLPAEPPGLGYRGFRYTLDGAVWRVWNGALVGPDRILHDPTRSVERLLLGQLPDEYADLRSRLEGEVTPET